MKKAPITIEEDKELSEEELKLIEDEKKISELTLKMAGKFKTERVFGDE